MVDTSRRIEVQELPKSVPSYKNSNVAKDTLTERWLTQWIEAGIKSKKLSDGDLLPIKSKLAYYLGVSIGTVQSAIRYMEDKGIVESKQKVGTFISMNNDKASSKKLTGKRDMAIKQISNYIIEHGLKSGEKMPSIRTLSKMFSLSTNTIRLAIEYLINNGILKNATVNNEVYLAVLKAPQVKSYSKVEMKTLTLKVEEEVLAYLKENFNVGDKFLTHHELAKRFDVSVKTMHDAIKSLIKRGYLVSRRGQYGTVVVKTSEKDALQPKPEMTIFASASQAAVYRYIKIENHLKQMITNDFALGTKLPSMQELASRLDVSTNTIKKALHNLAKQGYIGFTRGRYGGSFVINVPEMEEQSTFRWLAVSQKYVQVK